MARKASTATRARFLFGVGEPDQKKAVTAADVQAFANAIRKTLRYKQDNLRDGIMLAWAFRPDAVEAAERLRRLEQTDLNFIRLDMIRVDSPRFREHVPALSTDHADYENFLTFVQPPKVEVGYKRIAPAHLQVRRERNGSDERRSEDHQLAVGLQIRQAFQQHAGVFVRTREEEGTSAPGAVRVPIGRQEAHRL